MAPKYCNSDRICHKSKIGGRGVYTIYAYMIIRSFKLVQLLQSCENKQINCTIVRSACQGATVRSSRQRHHQYTKMMIINLLQCSRVASYDTAVFVYCSEKFEFCDGIEKHVQSLWSCVNLFESFLLKCANSLVRGKVPNGYGAVSV